MELRSAGKLLLLPILAILNAFVFAWIKTPTQEGNQVLTEIAGLRLFLKSVEQLPMQRTDEPADHAGIYEKYLPYAVALEVEQAWGDRFWLLPRRTMKMRACGGPKLSTLACGTGSHLRSSTNRKRLGADQSKRKAIRTNRRRTAGVTSPFHSLTPLQPDPQ